ncbi:MAG: ATP-binding protein [Clostridia bacterium]
MKYTEPATKTAIKNMILQSENITFEGNISNNQDLHFITLESVLNDNNIVFSKNIERTLGIINDKNIYTNLGLILSDDCPFTIKIAVYKDDTYDTFLDRKEFKGSLLKQIDNTIEYLNMSNKIYGEIKSINREDTFDYPIKAIREAVLNAVVHKEYSINSSIFIHVFSNNIKIVSLGSLYGDITLNDIIMGGISVTRNPKLQSILLRFNKVESLGTGIPRIMESYSNNVKKPEIIISDNLFTIILPKFESRDNSKDTIKNYLKNNEYITRDKAEELLNVGKTKAVGILNDLLDNNFIKVYGKGRSIKYMKNIS